MTRGQIARKKRNEKIIAALRAGEFIETLARRYGFTRKYIFNIAKDAGAAHLIKHNKLYTHEQQKLAARDARILEALKQNKEWGAIAREYGITRERVRQIGVKGGMPVQRRDFRKSRERDKNILNDFHRGLTIRELSAKYKVADGWVGKVIKKATGKGMRERQAERDKQITEQFRKVKNARTLSDEYKMSITSIHTILRRNGIHLQKIGKEKTLARNRQILEQFKQGVSASQMEEQYGLKDTSIRFILRQQGWRLNEMLEQRRAERKRQIAEGFRRGLTPKKLSEKFAISIPILYRTLHENGISIQKIKREKTRARNKRISECFPRLTPEQLAGKFAISIQTVYKALSENGISIKEAVKENKRIRNEEIKALYRRGASLKELGERFGLTQDHIYRILRT